MFYNSFVPLELHHFTTFFLEVGISFALKVIFRKGALRDAPAIDPESRRTNMLILSRKIGEKILIGEGIELMVVGVCGNRVRLGIAAPPECRIRRAEQPVQGGRSEQVVSESAVVAVC